ncbi:type II secretion system F family protein [Arachnia propionica]|uniref:Type II secretion system F family protein n=1 Tax=Arachnia propionica TaxID=1750 RepID=A0A3P1T774_9ACTN|nr:type II secretion system F family protein [Arachnia propionica]MDO5083975.1 type II secretion system F family protein [Arachnia propionica]RRD05229.1 type II secretion system F family protein [Arachnia propionica]
MTEVLVGICLGVAVLLLWPPDPMTRLRESPVPLSSGSRGSWWRRGRGDKDRSSASVAAELPQTLELMAVCLESGATLTGAVTTLRELSPPATAEVLGGVVAALHVGRDPTKAWLTLAEHPAWGPPARDLARALRSGTGMAESLRVHAEEVRRRRREAAMRAARAVGVKSVQPLMACFLPAFVLLGVVPLVASLVGRLIGPG